MIVLYPNPRYNDVRYKGAALVNLSLGFPTKGDSNHSPQLQRLARKLKFCS